jgi:hypothetical protein
MPATTRTSTASGQQLRRLVVPNPDDQRELFGDGAPTWTINKGKPGERKSPSAHEAMKQREATALKLRWHGNHASNAAANPTAKSEAALALAYKLDRCAPPHNPCLSGACPVCTRAQQRRLIMDTQQVLRPLVGRGYQGLVLSLVPEFGRIRAGSLKRFDIEKFDDAIRAALKACGIEHYKLGLDISLNQRVGVASPGFWQLQLWGFFHQPKWRWREELKAHLNPNGGVTRPVKVVKPDSLEAAAAYGLKNKFVRRVSYRKANLGRGDRGACWNTRDRHLRGDAWVELMLFLDRIGLQRRILLSGRAVSLPPLRSGNQPRQGGVR